MPIEFDIKLQPKDMYRFNMYQTYSGFHGIMSIVLAIFVFIAAVLTRGKVEMTYTILYVCFGVLFLVYMPVTLWMRSKHAIATSEVLKGVLHYSLEEDGVHVSQGGESAVLPWEQVYKMVSTKSNVLIYSTRLNAYVIPREQLGVQYDKVAELAKQKLEKYRVNMK